MKRIVFFDTETGGLTLDHPLIQIAAIAVDEKWQEVDTFEIKITVDPEKCEPEALKMNSYDEGIWKSEALDEETALRRFAKFLDRHRSIELTSKRGRPYTVARGAGHNARFDVDRVSHHFKKHGLFFPMQFISVLDTLQGALWYFERAGAASDDLPENYKLETLAKTFGIETEGAHDALVDVRMSIELAKIFLGVR